MSDANEKELIFISVLFLYNPLSIIKMPRFACLHILTGFILKIVPIFRIKFYAIGGYYSIDTYVNFAQLERKSIEVRLFGNIFVIVFL